MLVMVSPKDDILGHIEFFKTVNYLDEFELSYVVYAAEQRGKGVATEAINLLVRYLFETKRMNRIRLVIHPENGASRRLAEKQRHFDGASLKPRKLPENAVQHPGVCPGLC